MNMLYTANISANVEELRKLCKNNGTYLKKKKAGQQENFLL